MVLYVTYSMNMMAAAGYGYGYCSAYNHPKS